MSSRRDLLRSCPYFATLNDDLLDRVLSVSSFHTFEEGELLFMEGDTPASLFVVESGTIRIFKVSAEGKEQTLRLMRAGDTFADVPAFDGGGYPANSDAMERSTALSIPRAPLLDLMRQYPDIALGALMTMARRLRHMTGLVETLSLRRVMGRVANLLLTTDSSIHLSQAQMASMVGTGREMVNRSLNTLASRGIVELQGHNVVILDREKLLEVAENG
jgi:CRP-like cAMP-binding protein